MKIVFCRVVTNKCENYPVALKRSSETINNLVNLQSCQIVMIDDNSTIFDIR